MYAQRSSMVSEAGQVNKEVATRASQVEEYSILQASAVNTERQTIARGPVRAAESCDRCALAPGFHNAAQERVGRTT